MAGTDQTAMLPPPVAEEIEVLERVRRALESAPRPAWLHHQDRDLVELRDALAEEKLLDDRASLLEQMDRLAALTAIRERHAPSLVDAGSPYFGRLRLSYDDGRRVEILLGARSFFHDGVRIVDWRTAPVSAIFYRYQEGDDFDEEIARRRVTGRVERRRTVTIVGGRLVQLAAGEQVWQWRQGRWRQLAERAGLAGGAGSATRAENAAGRLGGGRSAQLGLDPAQRLGATTAMLDPLQFDLLTRDPEQLLVVTGGAGSGKTTVGLHRLAWWQARAPERFRAGRLLVLVFGRALQRYIERVLPALGLERVEVRTMRSWALGQMHKHFGDVNRRLVDNTPAVVVRLKSHPALVPMLEEAAAAYPGAEPLQLFDELFTDRGWLETGLRRHAPGAFSSEEIAAAHDWCTRLQFARQDNEERDDVQPGYDEDDPVILLRLYQLLRGPLRYSRGRRLGYDHIMVDEAQDFSPLELRVLLELVREQSLTLAGDPAQRLTPGALDNWSDALRVLPLRGHQVARLEVGYRCSRPITELAHAVLGPLAGAEPPRSERPGPPVELLRFAGPGPAYTFLGDALLDLQRREPRAAVAVLAPDRRGAERAWRALRRSPLVGLNLVADQEFSFEPGVDVCEVAATKGLEFDYVVLVGVDRDSYPLQPASRHLLHVGASRAVHQLWLLCWGAPSPVLPDWLEPRLAG